MRQAAYRLALSQLSSMRRSFWPGLVVWIGAIALGGYLALIGSPVGWTTVLFVGCLGFQVWLTRHLAARAALLAPGPTD